MPTYVYETITDDPDQREVFEVVQSMREEPLTVHPETGVPVRRVIQAPMIGGKWSSVGKSSEGASDSKLRDLGFTKYVKTSGGTYEKTVGEGPGRLDPRGEG
ncbi:MAG: FmdB family transcriptional regulator [Phycisphaeraceae bacterium]|nr:FmdB family transcriptional regulator [Phycisphaeraceae bacterium]